MKSTLLPILLALVPSSCIPAAGCSQLNQDDAATMVRLARDLGADVKVRGELGPARFGPGFQADLGARLNIEANTDTGSITARDLFELTEKLVDMLKEVNSEK